MTSLHPNQDNFESENGEQLIITQNNRHRTGIVWVQTHSHPAHPFSLLAELDSFVLYPERFSNLSSTSLIQCFAIFIMPFMLPKHIWNLLLDFQFSCFFTYNTILFHYILLLFISTCSPLVNYSCFITVILSCLLFQCQDFVFVYFLIFLWLLK